MTLTAQEPIATAADIPLISRGWRDEFGSTNSARLALRLAFPILACASLLPFVSPGIALMAGIALALTVGNPYPLTTARVITPLLQISVIGLGAGMNLAEVGRGRQRLFYTVIGITLTMSIGLTLGWLLRTERDTLQLVTVGTAICGGSAIAAVAPAIHAKHHEVSVALATVVFSTRSPCSFSRRWGATLGSARCSSGCGEHLRFTARVPWLARRSNMAFARWKSPRLSN
jgi:Conserved hypothetical protein 698